MEKQIAKLMESLEITREEAMEIIAFDKEEFEIEEVQEMTAKAKKVETPTKRGRKPKAEKTGMSGVTNQKRAKKENPTKAKIIEIIGNALKAEGMEIDVKNAEKTILFELDGNTYEIDLKQKRKPKES